jgi:uncharacterized protein (TIGR03067 family)
MRHTMGLALLTTALTAPAWADDKPVGDEKLYGTWVVTSAEFLGRTKLLPDNAGAFVFSKDGKVFIKIRGKTDIEGTFKVVGTKTPGQIDLTAPKEAGQKPMTSKGLYLVDGDTLQLIFVGPEMERPTAFDSKVAQITNLKRQKP